MRQEARHRSGTSKPRQLGGSRLGGSRLGGSRLGGSRLGGRQFVEEGRARPLLFWESRASTLANGAPEHAAVVTFGLKNSSRAASRWFDAQRLKHSGPDGEPIRQELTNILNMSGLDVEELPALKKTLMATVGPSQNPSRTNAIQTSPALAYVTETCHPRLSA